MNRQFVLLLILSVTVGACALGPPKAWKNNYTLRPMTPSAGRAPRQGATIDATLRVVGVIASDWLNNRDMYYRLDYGNPDKISAYSESRWLAPPPVMLRRLLLDALSNAGRWRAVVGPDTDVRVDYALRLHLTEFQQVFASQQKSYGLLLARGSLIDVRHDTVIAQQGFRFEVTARSPDSQGGADALREASYDLVDAVAQWLDKVMTRRPGGPGA